MNSKQGWQLCSEQHNHRGRVTPVVCLCSCCHEDVPKQAGAHNCTSSTREAQVTAPVLLTVSCSQRHWSSCSHAFKGMDGMIYSLSCFRGWLMETISCRAGSREKGAATPHRGREMLPLMMLRSGLHVLEVFPNLNGSMYLCSQAHTMRHLNTTHHTCAATSTHARKLWKLGATLPHGLKPTGASQASWSHSKLGLMLFQRAPHTLSENRYARTYKFKWGKGLWIF